MYTWLEMFKSRATKVLDSLSTEPPENMPINDEIRTRKILRKLFNQDADIEINILPEISSISPKNEESSARCHENAKELYRNKEFDSAHNCYTQGICRAFPNSLQLSNLYYSRSKLLFNAEMYAASLADIERINFDLISDELKSELYMQEAMCHKYLASEAFRISREYLPIAEERSKMQLEDDLEAREKLQGDTKKYFNRWDIVVNEPISLLSDVQNSLVPGLSNKVELKYTKKSGRHVVAKEDIPVGTVIGLHKPYLSCVRMKSRYNYCWHCSKQTWASIPCDDCENCVFCSESCREKAINAYHDIECSLIAQLAVLGVGDAFMMPLKLAIMGLKENGNSVDEFRKNMSQIDSVKNPLKKGLINEKIDSTKFSSVYIMFSKYTLRIPRRSAAQFSMSVVGAYVLLTKIGLFKNNPTRDLKLLMRNDDFIFFVGLFDKLMRIVAYNHWETNQPMMNGTLNLVCNSFTLTPAFGFFNHSCDHSFIRTFGAGSIALTTIKPIKKGDEIFDCYILDLLKYPRDYRKKKLLIKHDFVCNCIPCVEDWAVERSVLTENKSYVLFILDQLERSFNGLIDFRMKACEYYCLNNEILVMEESLIKKLKNFIKMCFLHLKENSNHVQMSMDLYAEYLVSLQVPSLSLNSVDITDH